MNLDFTTTDNGHYRMKMKNTLNNYTMNHRNKTRKYHAPFAAVTQMELESNFCQTGRFNIQVDELYNVNTAVDADDVDTERDPFYYEF